MRMVLHGTCMACAACVRAEGMVAADAVEKAAAAEAAMKAPAAAAVTSAAVDGARRQSWPRKVELWAAYLNVGTKLVTLYVDKGVELLRQRTW